jgi:hypothetical protein
MNINFLKKVVIFVSMLLMASPGYAYLDPGTGSMILQGDIAGIAMASITLKMYWHRFMGLFSNKSELVEPDNTKKDVKETDFKK